LEELEPLCGVEASTIYVRRKVVVGIIYRDGRGGRLSLGGTDHLEAIVLSSGIEKFESIAAVLWVDASLNWSFWSIRATNRYWKFVEKLFPKAPDFFW
jgi:hypothetical protein